VRRSYCSHVSTPPSPALSRAIVRFKSELNDVESKSDAELKKASQNSMLLTASRRIYHKPSKGKKLFSISINSDKDKDYEIFATTSADLDMVWCDVA
jgi:Sec-independent protein translocase protein TatA